MAGAFASRLCGSADIYEHSGKAPVNSINFVTCHDGFTLRDLVSYDTKHNVANGEDSRDGCGANYSQNYGHEGDTQDPLILELRGRQAKNFMATLLLSRGVPMILAGDEMGRTQQGNNNAYCQDNEISWLDWTLVERHTEFLDFVRNLIQLRRRYPVLSSERFYETQEISWFNAQGHEPNWHQDAAIACYVHPHKEDQHLCLIANPTTDPVFFRLPELPRGRRWVRVVDTGSPPPFDICANGEGVPIAAGGGVLLRERSLMLLGAER